MKLTEIKPYLKNAKKHPQKQIERIVASIKEFGFNQPLVIDKKNVIIVGHGRYEAAKLLNLTEVPVIQVNLSEEKSRAYRLADNKLNESSWDMELVIEELGELKLKDDTIDLIGFNKDLLIKSEPEDDAVPENVPSMVKLGDVWRLGNHRVMCGDSTKNEDIAKLMVGKKADMSFSDPPYGVGFKSNSKGVLYNDNFEYEDYKKFCISWLDKLKENTNFFVLTVGHKNKKLYYEYDNNLHELVWLKKNCHSKGFISYILMTEPLIVYGRPPNKRRYNFDYIEETIKYHKDLKDKHPCPKPIGLIEKIICPVTNRGMIILDLFLGSGTTLIACEKTNRICYGMEISPTYVDVILKRWENYTGKKAIKE